MLNVRDDATVIFKPPVVVTGIVEAFLFCEESTSAQAEEKSVVIRRFSCTVPCLLDA
jgi:hypothetical protein